MIAKFIHPFILNMSGMALVHIWTQACPIWLLGQKIRPDYNRRTFKQSQIQLIRLSLGRPGSWSPYVLLASPLTTDLYILVWFVSSVLYVILTPRLDCHGLLSPLNYLSILIMQGRAWFLADCSPLRILNILLQKLPLPIVWLIVTIYHVSLIICPHAHTWEL